ncbi:dihydroorotate dehydrogenase-like protein [Myxococcota bacterium]|nr:dihydroorotate dehydrogenase-like protein [Myxococcota bacterium]
MSSTPSNLNVTYMGLSLPSPLVAASSSMTHTLDGVTACAWAGAGAVVLKSLFEEQITAQVEHELSLTEDSLYLAEAADYVRNYTTENAVGDYLELIKKSKAAVDVPVIASIHCVTPRGWTRFAHEAELAGADGIECNVFIPPFDQKLKGADLEQRHLDIVAAIRKETSLPIALKVGYYFSNLYRTLLKFGRSDIQSLVLFNRFLYPDMDISTMKMNSSSVLSTSADALRSLRWIGILSPEIPVQLAASTGIHDSADAIKQLLAGAQVVQVCSSLIKNGPGHFKTLNEGISGWMAGKGFSSIDEFRGALACDKNDIGAAYERVQYMKLSFGDKS